jgi:hypothetical protein
MNRQIEHYISELLYLHDCVIIPGFGGFVGNKKSAYIHPVSGIIYPPSKAFLFNKNLRQNDGLLATHIARMEGIELSKTTDLIEDFVKKIQSELEQRSAFKLQNVGTFTKGREGNISFLQDKSYNYNLASFGMQANHKAKKVERTISQDKEVILKSIGQKDFGKTLRRAAAVLIPLIGLSLIGITQEENINKVYSQMANLNPFTSTKTEIVALETKPEVVIEIVAPTITKVKEETVKIAIPIVEQSKTYFIIAGAFAEKKNADRLLYKLSNLNYKPSIVKGGNLMRVSFNSFQNREDALLALAEIRKENKSAWLLTK